MWSKFLSRKFFIALAGFVTVNVIPNLPNTVQAQATIGVAIAYIIVQGIVDARAASHPAPVVVVPPVTPPVVTPAA